jgi:glycosyltransferase involved in cell wall biosynthesis
MSRRMHTLAKLAQRTAAAYIWAGFLGQTFCPNSILMRELMLMRCLVVTVLPPPDPLKDRHGVYQRLRMFVQSMSNLGCAVEIAHFVPVDQIGAGSESALSAISGHIWGAPVAVRLLPIHLGARRWWQTVQTPFGVRYRGDFRPYLAASSLRALRGLLDTQPDIIFAHRLPAMEALRRIGRSDAPVFFDLDDVEHLVKLRSAAPSRRFMVSRATVEAVALARAEHQAIRHAALTFICSSHDHQRLRQEGFNTDRVAVVPNAVAIPQNEPSLNKSETALFLGNFGHKPNAEAAERLITRIWPRVLAELPQARLIIAGDKPEMVPSFRESPEGVTFTGFVQDLAALYRESRIVCCPLTNGGGTRVKLIEAAAWSKPIVATTVAVEGLALRDARELLVRDTDAALAAGCLTLLTRDDIAESLAFSAQRMVQGAYSLPRIQSEITSLVRAMLQPERGVAQTSIHPEAALQGLRR